MSSPRHPLEVFPDLVWRKVFKKLGYVDQRSCNNSCHYFRYLLQPSAFWWNFHKIFPLIVGKGVDRGVHREGFRLNKNDILNCRLVCQAWRSTADNYIERCQECSEGPEFSIGFDSEDKIDRVINDIEQYPLSHTKFMWRKMDLRFREDFQEDPEEDFEAFWEKVYVLLQTIGFQVIRMSIYGINDHSSAGGLAFTKIVRRCLTSIPKVKEVTIFNEKLEAGDDWEYHFKNEINEIDEYFTNNALPNLPHLKSLFFSEEAGYLPVSLIKHLTIKYGPQLESLKAHCMDAIPRQLNFQILENLKNLEITTLVEDEDNLNDLDILDNLNCSLDNLRLHVDYHEELSVAGFLEKIQNLQVQNMDLQLSLSYDVPIPDNIRLTTIKSLSLDLGGQDREISFDFLEHCPNLEHLQFKFTLRQNANYDLPLIGNEKRIHLKDFFNNVGHLYESNIWNLLQKLQTIKYRRTRWIEDLRFDRKLSIYTRQECELFHKV